MKKESLLQKQFRFARSEALLIQQANKMGYDVTKGDAYRDPRVFGKQGERKGYGQALSAHKNRLATDLNLFRNGKYLALTEDHRKLGEWWESLGQDYVWGGRFDDGNHYSIIHDGIA